MNPGEPAYDVESRKFIDTQNLDQADELGELFASIYHSNRWGSVETRSGPGSERDRMKNAIFEFGSLIRDLGTLSVLDAPCGDFNWMREVDLSGISYLGCDIVPELVDANNERYGGPERAFTVLDITTSQLPCVDLVVCRDALVHFSYQHAMTALDNIMSSGSRYLLTTTFHGTHENSDIVTGWWRPLNLRRPPFDFPHPQREIRDDRSDDHYDDKVLALWRIADLP